MNPSHKTHGVDSRSLYTPPCVVRISELMKGDGLDETPCSTGSGRAGDCVTGISASFDCAIGNNAGAACYSGSDGAAIN